MNKIRTSLSLILFLLLIAACATEKPVQETSQRSTPPPMKIPAIENPRISRLPFEWKPDLYEQVLELEFASEKEAEAAVIEIAPLYEDYRLATSARWDDNCEENVPMRDLMNKYSIKGTFYVNGTDYFHNMETAGFEGKDYTAIARDLTSEGGHTVGTHALSHPYITYVNKNRMFEEIARCRAQWEAALDMPVNSHALSFTRYRNPVEGDVSHVNTARIMERSGIYHTATNIFNTEVKTDILESILLPPDGFGDLKGAIDWALNDPMVQKNTPNLSFSMHSWGWDDREKVLLEEMFRDLAARDDIWKASHNEYAAYRFQLRYAELSKDTRDGSSRQIVLKRPELIDVNHTIPLTIKVTGAEALTVKSADANIRQAERSGTTGLYNVFHNSDRRFPDKIAYIGNPENGTEAAEDSDYPGLLLLLRSEENQLILQITNSTDFGIENIQATFRLPLAYAPGVIRKTLPSVAPGETEQIILKPQQVSDDFRDLAGKAYFLAQVDFQSVDGGGRIYASCHTETSPDDRSFPLGNVLTIGPLKPEYGFYTRNFARAYRKGEISEEQIYSAEWLLDGMTPMQWTRIPREVSFYSKPYFDLEVVHLSDNWVANIPYPFLLATTVRTKEDRTVSFWCDPETVKHIFLNGEEVAFRDITLPAGDNQLLIVYENGQQNFGRASAAAAFFRIIDPVSKKRIRDLEYIADAVPLRENSWSTNFQ
ncbi:MAG: polysaccharide deacetylase family protein [Spirochaetales bacterium]|nr:polysaccharide deacetylase family protein [Spirochaetales bacterium]